MISLEDLEVSLDVDLKILFGSIHALFGDIALLRKVRPIVYLSPSGKIFQSCEDDGIAHVQPISTALGVDPLNTINAVLTLIQGLLTNSPYTNTIINLKSATVVLTSDGTGAVGSTAILAALAGKKHVIVEMSSIGYVTATFAAAVAQLTLSDIAAPNAILGIGPSATDKFGPCIQSTVNTAINASCGAAGATPSSTFIVTLRYWDS